MNTAFISRIPPSARTWHCRPSQLGIRLLFLSAGAVSGLPFAGTIIQRVGGIAGKQQPRFQAFQRMRSKKDRLFQSRNLFPAIDAFKFTAGIMKEGS